LLAGPLTTATAPATSKLRARTDGSPTFGRLFPGLEPVATLSAGLTSALMDLGHPGGILDARDDLDKGPVLLITDLDPPEFLPLFVGQSAVGKVLAALRSSGGSGAVMPVEFAGAAYRWPQHGAAVVPREPRGRPGPAVLRAHLRPGCGTAADPPDLTGGFRAPRRFIGWQRFIDVDDGEVRPNKKIDTTLSTPLIALPVRKGGSSRRFHPGAAQRPRILPSRRPTLAAHVADPLRGLPDGGLPNLRRRRPGQQRSVAAAAEPAHSVKDPAATMR
jgi:hypothetical protein